MTMTSIPARVLAGRTLTVAEVVEDYLQCSFGKAIGLTVYNDYEIAPAAPVPSLCWRDIKNIIEAEDHISFVFEGGVQLSVDLRPRAWRAPEAMLLWQDRQRLVVWN
jgi:hypothetical protein